MARSIMTSWMSSICCASAREALYLQRASVGIAQADAEEAPQSEEPAARPAS